MTAAEIREQAIWLAGEYGTKEELRTLRDKLDNMSDEEVLLAAELNGHKSLKDFVIHRNQLLLSGLEDEIPSLKQKIQPMSREDCIECLKQFHDYEPSDVIYLTKEQDKNIMHLWGFGQGFKTIPSDILFAKRVPLTDCQIIVDERQDGGTITDFRIRIFDDYAERVDRIMREKSESEESVGVLFFHTPDGYVVFLRLYVLYGVDGLLFKNEVGLYPFCEKSVPGNTYGFYISFGVQLLATWYGIQVALLHPHVQEIFKKPQRMKIQGSSSCKEQKHKRKTKYIRKHYVNFGVLNDQHSTSEQRSFDRKCLAWYVIGHWRHYSNGTKTFIQPYWKGVLRDIKSNMDGDERQRQIDDVT